MKVDRDSLGWDARVNGKQVFVYWKISTGSRGWYLGTLSDYDADSQKHTIKWADGDKPWVVNLMQCKKAAEWRFVQDGEDIDEFLE